MATHSSILAWRIPGTGAWWAAVYGVTQSRTQLKRLSSNPRPGDPPAFWMFPYGASTSAIHLNL